MLVFLCQQLPQLHFAVELFQISRESVSAPIVFLNFHFSLSFVGAAEKTAASSPRLPSMNTGDGGKAVILQLILTLTFQIIAVFCAFLPHYSRRRRGLIGRSSISGLRPTPPQTPSRSPGAGSTCRGGGFNAQNEYLNIPNYVIRRQKERKSG